MLLTGGSQKERRNLHNKLTFGVDFAFGAFLFAAAAGSGEQERLATLTESLGRAGRESERADNTVKKSVCPINQSLL